MKLEQMQDSIGYLQNDPEYKLDVTKMVTLLAVLHAYQKGVQGKFLDVEDLFVSIDRIESSLECLPAPFHQVVAYALSNVELCHKKTADILREFYYFNKQRPD